MQYNCIQQFIVAKKLTRTNESYVFLETITTIQQFLLHELNKSRFQEFARVTRNREHR